MKRSKFQKQLKLARLAQKERYEKKVKEENFNDEINSLCIDLQKCICIDDEQKYINRALNMLHNKYIIECDNINKYDMEKIKGINLIKFNINEKNLIKPPTIKKTNDKDLDKAIYNSLDLDFELALKISEINYNIDYIFGFDVELIDLDKDNAIHFNNMEFYLMDKQKEKIKKELEKIKNKKFLQDLEYNKCLTKDILNIQKNKKKMKVFEV